MTVHSRRRCNKYGVYLHVASSLPTSIISKLGDTWFIVFPTWREMRPVKSCANSGVVEADDEIVNAWNTLLCRISTSIRLDSTLNKATSRSSSVLHSILKALLRPMLVQLNESSRIKVPSGPFVRTQS